MTLRAYFEARLFEHGLFESEATAVMDKAEKDSSLEAMQRRWADDTEAYPSQLLAACWLSVKRCAAEWLEANKPKHWALPVFRD